KTFSARRVNERAGKRGTLWQRGYYEHVIRNEKALNRIRDYIANNPALWAEDPDNLSGPDSAERGGVENRPPKIRSKSPGLLVPIFPRGALRRLERPSPSGRRSRRPAHTRLPLRPPAQSEPWESCAGTLLMARPCPCR